MYVNATVVLSQHKINMLILLIIDIIVSFTQILMDLKFVILNPQRQH